MISASPFLFEVFGLISYLQNEGGRSTSRRTLISRLPKDYRQRTEEEVESNGNSESSVTSTPTSWHSHDGHEARQEASSAESGPKGFKALARSIRNLLKSRTARGSTNVTKPVANGAPGCNIEWSGIAEVDNVVEEPQSMSGSLTDDDHALENNHITRDPEAAEIFDDDRSSDYNIADEDDSGTPSLSDHLQDGAFELQNSGLKTPEPDSSTSNFDPTHQTLLSGKPSRLRMSLSSTDFKSTPQHAYSLRLTLANRTYETEPIEKSKDLATALREELFDFELSTQAWLFGVMKADILEHRPGTISLPGVAAPTRIRVWARALIPFRKLEMKDRSLEKAFSLEKKARTGRKHNSMGWLRFRFQLRDELTDEQPAEKVITRENTKVKQLPFFIQFFMPKRAKNVVTELSVLYHAFFGTGWRMTKSEFFTAYLELENYWKCREPLQRHTGRIVNDEDFIVKAQRFLRMSIAAYGSFALHFHGITFKVAAKNMIRMHSDRAAICEVFGLTQDEILKWHFHSADPSTPNYFIGLDRTSLAVMIVVRGTFNIIDMITDINAGYVPYKQGLVHEGIFKSGKYILDHDVDLIKAALEENHLRHVICCGHSLGGAVASICAVLLREALASFTVGHGPSPVIVEAYSFAGPPTMSFSLSQRYKGVVHNFVNDSDIVPYASYGTATELKSLCRAIIEVHRTPETKTLSKAQRKLKIRQAIDAVRHDLLPLDDKTKLFLPGEIYFFVAGYTAIGDGERATRFARDILCERLDPRTHNEMIIRRLFILFHMPLAYDYHLAGSKAFLENCRSEQRTSGEMILRGGSKMKWSLDT